MIWVAIVCRRAVVSISEPIVTAWIMPMKPTTRITEAIITSTMVKPFDTLRAGRFDKPGVGSAVRVVD